MIFAEEFLSDLKNDPLEGAQLLVSITRDNLVKDSQEWNDHDHKVLIEAYALIVEIIEAQLLNLEPPAFGITGHRDTDCQRINQYLSTLEGHCVSESSRLRLESLRSHFKNSLGSGFCYEFSQGDLERVQLLVNQIRDLIAQTRDLEKDHKRRLLNRLERLQSELHKKVSDLDRFWGLIGDAGVVLGKLGTDAKPVVDRIKEVAEIVWQTQSRAEELPSSTQIPLLNIRSNTEGSEV